MKRRTGENRLRGARGYLLAVVLSGLVLLIRVALGPILGERAPLAAFTLAVAVAASLGGLGPGLLATLLGACLGVMFFYEPAGTFVLGTASDVVNLLLFLSSSVLISVLGHRMRRSVVRAEQAILEDELVVVCTITENASDAFFILEEQGTITFMNARAKAWLSHESQSAIGRPLHDLLHPKEGDTKCALRQAIRDHRALEPTECLLSRPDGTQFPGLCSVRIIHRANRQRTMFVEIRDLTVEKQIREERERMLERERAARVELGRASRMKDELMDMVSHELRTPLTAILGWVQLLRRQPSNSSYMERGLGIIERNARMQEQLVSDLLDASRARVGKISIEKRSIAIESVIEAAIDSVRLDAEAKGIHLKTVLEPSSVALYGDASRLQQVFWNLLTNAIKFTSQGGHIEISLSVKEGFIEVSVQDDGRGIDAADLPHVFDRFWQANSPLNRDFRGLGLGLPIVEHIVRLHGGRVRAESEGLGKGARLVVELPYGDSLEELAREEPRHSIATQEAPLRGLCIMVVEDEPDVLDFIQQVLEAAGARVITATSAEDALTRLATMTPNVLVSDIGMPGMDGYEMIRKLREVLKKVVPALALTAFSREEDRAQAIQAGFHEHLSKPIAPTELQAIVARLAIVR
ncbi:MAG: response regulator [Polyangiaceae bacterium]|nr:response regulator [Polyangiaceae bacterium]